MQKLEYGAGTGTKEGMVYGDINIVVDVSGGGTLEIQGRVNGSWVTIKTVTGDNEMPKVEVANALPLRLNVTGAIAYHVY